MKGRAHPSPFAALAFPNLKKVPIHCCVDREFSSHRMVKSSLELTTLQRLSAPHWAALTTRPWRLSKYVCTICNNGSKICKWNGKQCRPWSNCSWGAVWILTRSFLWSSLLRVYLNYDCKKGFSLPNQSQISKCLIQIFGIVFEEKNPFS